MRREYHRSEIERISGFYMDFLPEKSNPERNQAILDMRRIHKHALAMRHRKPKARGCES